MRSSAPGTGTRDPRHIEHVTELQYRLRWVGAYGGPVTGYYDGKVRDAVKRYQKRVGLQVNGVANHQTWAKLIPQTVKARGLIHRLCKPASAGTCATTATGTR